MGNTVKKNEHIDIHVILYGNLCYPTSSLYTDSNSWLYFGTKLNGDIELTDYLTLFANFRSNPRLFDTI